MSLGLNKLRCLYQERVLRPYLGLILGLCPANERPCYFVTMLQLHLRDQRFYCLLRCDLYYRFDGIDKNLCGSVAVTLVKYEYDLTGKTWVNPASFPSLPYINLCKIVLWSSKFQILFWRLSNGFETHFCKISEVLNQKNYTFNFSHVINARHIYSHKWKIYLALLNFYVVIKPLSHWAFSDLRYQISPGSALRYRIFHFLISRSKFSTVMLMMKGIVFNQGNIWIW